MNIYTPESIGALVQPHVQGYLDRTATAKMTDVQRSALIHVSKQTIYNWKKNLPDGGLPTYLLFNVLLANKMLDRALADGSLPAKSRKHAQEWVDSAIG